MPKYYVVLWAKVGPNWTIGKQWEFCSPSQALRMRQLLRLLVSVHVDIVPPVRCYE